MRDEITFIDQVRESKRIRVIGEQLSDLLVLKKSERLPSMLLTNQQERSKSSFDLTHFGWELLPTRNPFDLSFSEFLRLSPDESEEMLKKANDLCKSLIQDAWSNGYRQVILCKNEVIFKTHDDEPVSASKVKQLAKKRNSACYVFSAPDIVEESTWTPISGDDSYPTIKIFLGSENTADKDIIEKSSPVFADLDTGNPHYKMFNVNLFSQELQKFTPFELRQGMHLGCDYSYFNKRVKICVQDINGNINSFVCLVRMVRDWDRCAVVQISPKRTGYVGRDLLRALRVRLKIDPLHSTTQILDVS